MSAWALRPAEAADVPGIAALYGHHVAEGFASFEEVPPDAAEMARRRETLVGSGFPYLVAADEAGTVLGYAYAGPYRPRSAYRFTVEDSIYVAPAAAGRGIGRALLSRLIEECRARGYRQIIAVIGDIADRIATGASGESRTQRLAAGGRQADLRVRQSGGRRTGAGDGRQHSRV